MYINELAEPQLLVIYPGRFQPFHKGHHAVYEWLTGKFGRNNVYIATSNKTDAAKSPFSFAEKAYFMQLTGVPADRIVQASQPYNITNVLAGGHIPVADHTNTVVVFAVSQKDMDEDPRFSFAAKKDGSPAYFQKFTTIKETESMDKHGYIMTVPTFDFTVLNQPMRSGTELRKMYEQANEKQRQAMVADLFGRYTHEAEQIMTAKLGGAAEEPVQESMSVASFQNIKNFTRGQTVELLGQLKDQSPGRIRGPGTTGYDISVTPTHMNPDGILRGVHTRLIGRILANAVREGNPSYFVPAGRMQGDTSIDGYYKLLAYRYKQNPASLSNREKEQLHNFLLQRKVFKESGGVGIVRGGTDPRYVTATMGDQNDVDGDTLGQEMAAYGLVGRKSPGGQTQQRPVGKNIGQGRS
jgi:hypothetical protein